MNRDVASDTSVTVLAGGALIIAIPNMINLWYSDSLGTTIISSAAITALFIFILWVIKLGGIDIFDRCCHTFRHIFTRKDAHEDMVSAASMDSYLDAIYESYSHSVRWGSLDVIKHEAKVAITKDDWLAMMRFSKKVYRLDALAWWDDGFLKAFIMGFNATKNPVESTFIAGMFNDYGAGYQMLSMIAPRRTLSHVFRSRTKIVDMFQAYIDSGHDIHDMLPPSNIMADESRYSAGDIDSEDISAEDDFLARAADGTPYRSIYLDLIKEHGENALLQDTSIIQEAFKKHE
jgi:hypothetical protein